MCVLPEEVKDVDGQEGNMGVVWGRIGQRGVWRNIVKVNSRGRRCGKARTVGTSLPHLQNLQSDRGPAASLLYSWLPGEGKQGIIVQPSPGFYGGRLEDLGFSAAIQGGFSTVRRAETRCEGSHAAGAGEVAGSALPGLDRKASHAYKKI